MTTNPRPIARPADWPAPGPIDLDVHDRPHASSDLEWWYVNSYLETEGGRRLGVFAAFFRQRVADSRHAHFVTWALTGEDGGYAATVRVDDATRELALLKVDQARSLDERSRRALREILARGAVPLPTRRIDGAARVDDGSLSLSYGADSFKKRADGDYELTLRDDQTDLRVDLVFHPEKPPARQGDDGVIRGAGSEQMFYYFIPRCAVRGTIAASGREEAVARGSGWYDHELGFVPEGSAAGGENAWTWASLQLEDGTDVSIYLIRPAERGGFVEDWVVVSDAAGRVRRSRRVSMRVESAWRSLRTFVEYPVQMTFTCEELDLEISVRAVHADQEVVTILSEPSFWEGQVVAAGSLRGAAVRGRGWVELRGYGARDLDAFLRSVGDEVRRVLAETIPSRPAEDRLRALVTGSHARPRDGFDRATFEAKLIAPIREILDRGGKTWRSFAILACVELVGGDARRFRHWLAVPELIHTGSLIVDDAEDRSVVRRGGPTCHLMHGDATAINAGTAAYFLGEPPVHRDAIPDRDKLRVYALYFEAMRAGHAGQALDLAGLAPTTLDDDELARLSNRLLSIHHLKSAVPPASMARIGAILGGGSDAQVDAVGRFFEALGLAFQIVDDVLNLRGFAGDLKTRGEDVMHGKLTLPILDALGSLPRADRAALAHAILVRPTEGDEVGRILSIVEAAGANERCMARARAMVEVAWAELDPLVPDSQAKIAVRAFAWYLLERHY
ncbi:polyprenyl synthetase family protein [Sorangium sp. So ce302]|uniref:polyprenyl synthetase family protein n=1 Tax=Sorangium sp. So ce302 TaxID=3133297 RepID=UPI003F5F6B8A